LDALATDPASAVFASSYVLGGQLALRTGKPVGVISPRRSQFDVWGPPSLRLGDAALWVSEGDAPPDELAGRFTRVEALPPLEGRFGELVTHTFTVWQLSGAR
ncbi:MAG: 4-amino-4-deoxy-L-arabinose transferase, partial [Archangium sp.]|nr:4-amino-4-deoxy-L-arabinose transferase [Archangium sp.]